MGVIDSVLQAIGIKKTSGKGIEDTAYVSVSPSVVYKEMALYTAVSIIANAISACEFKVYNNKKEVKNEDWFRLNIAPNKNENASLFWNRVIFKCVREKEAFVLIKGGELHLIPKPSIERRDLKGDIYTSVSLSDGTSLEEQFTTKDIYRFSLESKDLNTLINSLWEDYGSIYQAAARAFKDSNARRYILKLDGIKAGDEDFVKDWEDYIKGQIESYMKNEYSTYVQYEGYELEKEQSSTPKTADDLVKIKKDMFETVGQALKIPTSLMTGNVTSVKDVMNVFLTFGADPWGDMIGRELNRVAGYENVSKGNYYRVNTGKIKHRDPIEDAVNIEKLISSGFADIDEARVEMDYIPLDEPWSKIHWLTKNWAKVEDVANGLDEGGASNAGTD